MFSTSRIMFLFIFGCKGIDMIDFGCRSRCRACRFWWFSIFWIKSRTLTSCNKFTAECGTPGMLKSMSSSLILRLNSLSVLNDASWRCISWTYCSFFVCAVELLRSSGCPVPSCVCSTRVFFRQITSFSHARRDFRCLDLSETQSFSWKPFPLIWWEWDVSPLTTNTHLACPQAALFDYRLVMGLVRWVGRHVACWTSPRDCRTTILLVVDQL